MPDSSPEWHNFARRMTVAGLSLGFCAAGVKQSPAYPGASPSHEHRQAAEYDPSLKKRSDAWMQRWGLPIVPRRVFEQRSRICRSTDLAMIARVGQLVRQEDKPEVRSTLVALIETTLHGSASDSVEFPVSAAWIGNRYVAIGEFPIVRPGDRVLFLLGRDTRTKELEVLGNGYGAVPLDPEARLPPSQVLAGLWDLHCAHLPTELPKRKHL